MTNQIITLVMYCIPAIIVGAVAFYFFRIHIENEDRKRLFLLQQEAHKYALPIRLQAYERMTLFLERISFADSSSNIIKEGIRDAVGE